MIARSAIAALGAVLLAIQLASMALFAPLAAAPSVPRWLEHPWPFAAARALGLDRLAFVQIELARAALLRGETARAASLLAPATTGDEATDVRAHIAEAKGDLPGAMRGFGSVGDIDAAGSIFDRVGARDRVAAYALVQQFAAATPRKLPAPVAGALAFREGTLAANAAQADPAHRDVDLRAALAFFQRAVAIDPTQEAYALSLGFVALLTHDAARARAAYADVAARDPHSVDAFTGLAYSYAALGDCTAASTALGMARRLNGGTEPTFTLVSPQALAGCRQRGDASP
jgi:tetratricopeptide (TPR) repeat protein